MPANRFILIASQAVGQLSIIFATPFLTRVFDPEELGLYQLAFTIGLLLQPFLTLRYESIIPSEKSEAAVPQYLRYVAIASVTVVTAMSIIGLLGDLMLPGFSVSVIAMIAVVAIGYSLTAVDNAVLIRQKEMNRLAVRNFLSGALVATLQVAFAYLLGSVLWVAIAILVGRLVSILLTRKRGELNVRVKEGTAGVHFDTGRTLYRISSALVASLSLHSMVLYSQISFGPSATAYVGMAHRSASAPLGLVSQALTQGVQATIGESVRTGDVALLRHVHREMRWLLPYAAVTTLGLVILGPLLAVPVFGSGWETTGTIIAILGVPSGLQLMVSPVTSVFYMLEEEGRIFWIQLVRLLLSVLLALTFQLVFDELVLAVAGYAIGTSISYVYTYVALKDTIRKVYPQEQTAKSF